MLELIKNEASKSKNREIQKIRNNRFERRFDHLNQTSINRDSLNTSGSLYQRNSQKGSFPKIRGLKNFSTSLDLSREIL